MRYPVVARSRRMRPLRGVTDGDAEADGESDAEGDADAEGDRDAETD